MLGELLIKLRKERGITQKDLAEKLHTTDKSISRWENEINFPSLEMMYQISKFYNVPFNSLITARVETEKGDATCKAIVKELSEINKKRLKITKICLIITVIIILILTIAMIFTSSFNRFKVYKVSLVNSDFINMSGVYVETKMKDMLNLGDIKIKGVEIKESDVVLVDLYYIDKGEEKILNNYTQLENIYFVGYQDYVETGDLSDYINDIYLRVIIINSKGKETNYETQLDFVLDFTNNKILYKDDLELFEIANGELSNNELTEILLENGFERISNFNFYKKSSIYKINYLNNSKKVTINFEKNKLHYRYVYGLENKILEVKIYADEMTDIQYYIYDVGKSKIINCVTGTCNDYKYAMKIINDNFLSLLTNN